MSNDSSTPERPATNDPEAPLVTNWGSSLRTADMTDPVKYFQYALRAGFVHGTAQQENMHALLAELRERRAQEEAGKATAFLVRIPLGLSGDDRQRFDDLMAQFSDNGARRRGITVERLS